MSDIYDPPERVATESHCRGMDKYNDMYNESLDDPKKFWSRICQQFYWKTPIPEGTLMVKVKYLIVAMEFDIIIFSSQIHQSS